MNRDFRVRAEMVAPEQKIENLQDTMANKLFERRFRQEARITLALCGLAKQGASFSDAELQAAYNVWTYHNAFAP